MSDIAWSDLFPAHSLGLLLTSVVLSRVVAALSVSVRELDSLILVGPPFGAHRSRKNAVSLAASHAADMLCLCHDNHSTNLDIGTKPGYRHPGGNQAWGLALQVGTKSYN